MTSAGKAFQKVLFLFWAEKLRPQRDVRMLLKERGPITLASQVFALVT